MVIKLVLLKLLDNTIGKILVNIMPCEKRHDVPFDKNITKILIIRPGGIGDFVLLLPAIQLLRLNFKTSRIDILCEKRNSGIANFAVGINNTYLYDRGFDLIRCLKNKYDVVIDTEQWHRLSAIITCLVGASVKIGFDTNERKKIYTHKIPYSHDDYEACSFLNLIRPLICKTEAFNPNKAFVIISNGATQNPSIVSHEDQDKLIAISLGASAAERRWQTYNFIEVAESFSRLGFKIALLGSKKEKSRAAKIKKKLPDCIDLTSKTSLKDTAYILMKSKLLLTADSGLMHLAYALGTSTVSLFGAGIEKKWAPRGRDHIVINNHLSCSPCTRFGYASHCDKNIECLTLIGAGEVISAMKKMLPNSKSQALS